MKIKKSKTKLIIQSARHIIQKLLTHHTTSSCLHGQMASGSKTKEFSNYWVYFERIFKLQGWNLNFFFTGE